MIDLVHVPTCAELAESGLARVVARTAKGAPTHYMIEPEGQQMIYDAQRRNGLAARADDELHPFVPQRMILTPAQAAHVWSVDAFNG